MRETMLLVVLMLTAGLCGDTLTVSWDGTQDYLTVQSAVDAAQNGDTVLVHPGHYFENIFINDKFITLASLELTTGDPQYIHSTILDGDFNGSVIRIELDTVPSPADMIIQGFSIIRGSGYIRVNHWPEYGGGGVNIYGEWDYYHEVQITNCQIKYNRTTTSAGVTSVSATLHMRNVSIHHNEAQNGVGGVNVVYGNLITYSDSPCNIYSNFASYKHDISVVKTEYNTTIYADTLSVTNPGPGFIYYRPKSSISPPPQLTVVQQNHVFEEVDHDLYVAPDGNDANSGLSPAEPLRTIWKASYIIVSNPDHPRTIYIAPGEYSESLNGQRFGVGLKPYVSIIGAGVEETTLRLEDAPGLIWLWYSNNRVSGMTLTSDYPVSQSGLIWSPTVIRGTYPTDITLDNLRITGVETGRLPPINVIIAERVSMRNVVVENNLGLFRSGMQIESYDLVMEDCVVRNNHVTGHDPDGHVIPGVHLGAKGMSRINGLIVMNNVNDYGYDWNRSGMINIGTQGDEGVTDVHFTNCLFAGNTSLSGTNFRLHPGSGSVSFTNCTFADNSSAGSTIEVQYLTDTSPFYGVHFINTALWDSTAYEISNVSYEPCTIEMDYSLVRGGIDGIFTPNHELIWGDGNINLDPMLQGPREYFYPLDGSPLINAGIPDTTGLGLPVHDIFHRARVWDGRVDIGCHEFGSVGVTPEDEPIPPLGLALHNFPNPFNPSTTIRCALPQDGNVSVRVYNARGQLVRTLVDGDMPAGYHDIVWDGRDNHGSAVGSGVYLCRMQAGSATLTHKLLMLK
ncbi:MAG: T9SS type A sorting domain-containing protein [Candidatus Cloacimonetes bacterium]|nr:T9SS type A sorting domain-containing protein [Candidatus Cloacimonadota bacterium]